MSLLPNSSTVSYAGLQFLSFTTHITAKPKYDSANRATVGVSYSLAIKGYIEAAGKVGSPPPGGPTDTTLLGLRRSLTQPGAPLVVQNTGFGDLVVNKPGGAVWDLEWGPHPELIDAHPVGNNLVWYVEWRVTTTIPECTNALYRFGIAEFCFGQNISLDEDGYSTVTTKGHVIIPQTRAGASVRTLTDHCDSYRERIKPTLSLGFRRKTQTYEFSEDKRRLDFTTVDEQVPTPLLPGATRMPIEHEIVGALAAGEARGFVKWTGTISGSITMPPGVGKQRGLLLFMSLVEDRIQAARGLGAPRPFAAPPFLRPFFGPDVFLRPGQHVVMLTRVSVREEVTGRSLHCSVSYFQILRGGLREVFEQSGQFRAIPGTDFQQWQRSLDDTVNNVRGQAGWRAQPENDIVIDLCAQADVARRSAPRLAPRVLDVGADRDAGARRPDAPAGFVARAAARLRRPIEVEGTFDTQGAPPAEQSWLDYECHLLYMENGRYARHVPLAGASLDQGRNKPDAGGSVRDQGRTPSLFDSAARTVPDILQEVRGPSGTIRLIGRAVRWGHKVPIPTLTRVAGQVPVCNKVTARQWSPFRYLDVPVYFCTWDVEFFLPLPPTRELPCPANPMLGTDAT